MFHSFLFSRPTKTLKKNSFNSAIADKFAPDYKKLRSKLAIYNASCAIAVLILEILISTGMYFAHMIEHTPIQYICNFLIVPTIINFGAVSLQFIIIRRLKAGDFIKNQIVTITLSVISIVIASVHYTYRNTMMIFSIPILTSSAFCNRKMTYITAAINYGGLGIAALFRYFSKDGDKNFLIPEIIISIVLITTTLVGSQLIISVMQRQNYRLAVAVKQAQTAKEEAQSANQAKSSFLVNMSHEIRTPINAILGMNEMILREEQNPNIRDYATNIESSGNMLLSIINDVIDISKIETGKIEITNSSYELASLINDCYNLAVVRAKGKDLEVYVECDENIPSMLMGDETHIRQIIVNLLTNAVKYTEKGYVKLVVGGEYYNDKFVLVTSVIDTGIGISKENLKHVFGRFERFDAKRNRGIEGSGVGLAIVKNLVDLMDGDITVDSEVDVGSEFRLVVPQGVVDRTPIGKLSFNKVKHQDHNYVRSFVAPDARILAVDDLPVNLMVLTNMLKSTEVQVDTATSGKEAIELAQQNHYDIILMDHLMPEMDGIQTYSKLKEMDTMCNNTPVIMLTANALAGLREQYMHVGFADYISKPVKGDKLESVIKNHLPPELVLEDDGNNSPAGKQSMDKLSVLTETLPSINLSIGLPFCCDSEEFFLEILRQFSENDRYEQMQTQFENDDFEGYRINAHALKSTSLSIGLEKLSERARSSEYALKIDNIEFAKFNHPELMELYKETLDKIREFFRKTN